MNLYSGGHMRILFLVIFGITLLTIVNAQSGHGLHIYPNEGQDQDQTDLDEFQCIKDATNRTGFDPMAVPTATTAPPQTEGGTGKGAVRGAVIGTATGAIAGDTGKGAAIGAATGGLIGGMRRQDSKQRQQQWAQKESASYQKNRNNWTRAFTACMQSRGYTVG